MTYEIHHPHLLMVPRLAWQQVRWEGRCTPEVLRKVLELHGMEEVRYLSVLLTRSLGPCYPPWDGGNVPEELKASAPWPGTQNRGPGYT